jgi:hypothetical protein
VAGTCAVSAGTTCLVVVGVGAGATFLDGYASNDCGSDLAAGAIAGGTTIVMASPGLPLTALEAAGKTSVGLGVGGRLGLNAPGEALGLGAGPAVENGGRDRYLGGSDATSSC